MRYARLVVLSELREVKGSSIQSSAGKISMIELYPPRSGEKLAGSENQSMSSLSSDRVLGSSSFLSMNLQRITIRLSSFKLKISVINRQLQKYAAG